MNTRTFIAFVFAAAVVLLGCVTPVEAYDEVKLREAERLATLLQAQLRGVANRIGSGTLQDDALAAQRPVLEKMRAAASAGAENASGPLGEIRTQVEGLGPAPADGQEETTTIATQRKELNAQLARATAAQKQFVLVGLEAEQALSRLTTLQRGQFLQRIFKADRSVLNPALWSNTADGAKLLWQRLGTQLSKGLSDAESGTNYTGLLFLPIGLMTLWLVFFRFLPNVADRLGFGTTTYAEEPADGLQKLWHVIWSFAKYLLAVGVVMFLVLATLEVVGINTPALDSLLNVLLDAVEPAVIYAGLIYFVTSPREFVLAVRRHR